MESAVGVICEFLQFLLIYESWYLDSPKQYHSAITDATYELEHYRCERFDTKGEDRFNRNGMWVFTKENSRVDPQAAKHLDQLESDKIYGAGTKALRKDGTIGDALSPDPI